MSKKAMVAMSGGVDSSVAAYLMKSQGYDTIGITLKLFDNEDIGLNRKHTCCSLDDVADARSVAFKLDIPYYVFNFGDRFKKEVIDRFVDSYQRGHTPNPCIDCNRYIKFKDLLFRAEQLGFDYVVTGHYARIEFDEQSGRYLLKKGLDDNKDQTYMLFNMTQEQLSKVLFPVGHIPKPEVRKIATEQGFRNAQKHDSQDICFVVNGNYVDFIENYTNTTSVPGNFLTANGEVIGKHKGILHYTIGQRKGLGISAETPLYVSNKDVDTNTVTVSKESELYSNTLIANDINLISCECIEQPTHIYAKVRYRQKEQPATVEQIDKDTIRIVFDEPQRAITKGQAVVLYDGDTVVGGGTIIESF